MSADGELRRAERSGDRAELVRAMVRAGRGQEAVARCGLHVGDVVRRARPHEGWETEAGVAARAACSGSQARAEAVDVTRATVGDCKALHEVFAVRKSWARLVLAPHSIGSGGCKDPGDGQASTSSPTPLPLLPTLLLFFLLPGGKMFCNSRGKRKGNKGLRFTVRLQSAKPLPEVVTRTRFPHLQSPTGDPRSSHGQS